MSQYSALQRLRDEMRASCPMKASGDVSASQVHMWADQLDALLAVSPQEIAPSNFAVKFIPKRACEGAEPVTVGEGRVCPHQQCYLAVDVDRVDDPTFGFKAACPLKSAASSPAQAQGWRDIATAPKDGATILALLDSGRPEIIHWADDYYAPRWRADNGNKLCCAPTHWLPLPPDAPGAVSGEQKVSKQPATAAFLAAGCDYLGQQYTRLTTVTLLVSLQMSKPRPHVAAAFFCESILEGKDGTLSAIRIVDTYSVPPIPSEAVPPDAIPGILVTGLVALKSGDVTGAHTVRLILENPLGVRTDISPKDGWPVVLEGGHGGVNLVLKFPLGVKNFGQCWFDVLFDDEVLTRMPLKLQRAGESAIAGSPR